MTSRSTAWPDFFLFFIFHFLFFIFSFVRLVPVYPLFPRVARPYFQMFEITAFNQVSGSPDKLSSKTETCLSFFALFHLGRKSGNEPPTRPIHACVAQPKLTFG